jgi:hypothetical protein
LAQNDIEVQSQWEILDHHVEDTLRDAHATRAVTESKIAPGSAMTKPMRFKLTLRTILLRLNAGYGHRF